MPTVNPIPYPKILKEAFYTGSYVGCHIGFLVMGFTYTLIHARFTIILFLKKNSDKLIPDNQKITYFILEIENFEFLTFS